MENDERGLQGNGAGEDYNSVKMQKQESKKTQTGTHIASRQCPVIVADRPQNARIKD